jgi:cytochrome c oxidase subunit 1
MPAQLKQAGWYRAGAFLLLGFAFCFSLTTLIRSSYGYDPLVDWDAIAIVSMIGMPLFFLVGLGAFDYWFYWASGRPSRPEDHSAHGAHSWKDYFKVKIMCIDKQVNPLSQKYPRCLVHQKQ